MEERIKIGSERMKKTLKHEKEFGWYYQNMKDHEDIMNTKERT